MKSRPVFIALGDAMCAITRISRQPTDNWFTVYQCVLVLAKIFLIASVFIALGAGLLQQQPPWPVMYIVGAQPPGRFDARHHPNITAPPIQKGNIKQIK
jgi:hypothetical protein